MEVGLVGEWPFSKRIKNGSPPFLLENESKHMMANWVIRNSFSRRGKDVFDQKMKKKIIMIERGLLSFGTIIMCLKCATSILS